MNSDKIKEEVNTGYNQLVKKIRLGARIKDCFHPVKKECVMPIKNAHSIQKQGSLSFLEKNKNGNKSLYIHTERNYNSEHNFFDLKNTGRKIATTFMGSVIIMTPNYLKQLKMNLK